MALPPTCNNEHRRTGGARARERAGHSGVGPHPPARGGISSASGEGNRPPPELSIWTNPERHRGSRHMAIAAHPQASADATNGHEPADVRVVFGITGDLAKVMTFNSLYRLEQRGLVSCPIVGVAV